MVKYIADDGIRATLTGTYNANGQGYEGAWSTLESVCLAAHAAGYGAFIPTDIYQPNPLTNTLSECGHRRDAYYLFEYLSTMDETLTRDTMGAELNYWARVTSRLVDLSARGIG